MPCIQRNQGRSHDPPAPGRGRGGGLAGGAEHAGDAGGADRHVCHREACGGPGAYAWCRPDTFFGTFTSGGRRAVAGYACWSSTLSDCRSTPATGAREHPRPARRVTPAKTTLISGNNASITFSSDAQQSVRAGNRSVRILSGVQHGRRGHQVHQGRGGRVRRRTVHRPPRCDPALLDSGQGLHGRPGRRGSGVRRFLGARLPVDRRVRHAAAARLQHGAHRPVPRGEDAEPELLRARPVHPRGLQPRPAQHRPQGGGVPAPAPASRTPSTSAPRRSSTSSTRSATSRP